MNRTMILLWGLALMVGTPCAWGKGQRLEQKVKPSVVSAKVKAERVGAKREELKEGEPKKQPKTAKVERPPSKEKTSAEIWWEIRRKQKQIF